MARTGKAPARASHTARRSARARVRGKTGRVSFPRAVPTADMRQNGIPHSDATVRKTLVFLQSAERPVLADDGRVDLARTFVGGFVSVPASAGVFRGSVSKGDISGTLLRLKRPRESTKRFSLRPCAGVNLETENALARASDARSSACRPARRTHKVHSGAACVSECVATTLRVAHALRARLPDFAKLSEWRARCRDCQMVSARDSADRPVS